MPGLDDITSVLNDLLNSGGGNDQSQPDQSFGGDAQSLLDQLPAPTGPSASSQYPEWMDPGAPTGAYPSPPAGSDYSYLAGGQPDAGPSRAAAGPPFPVSNGGEWPPPVARMDQPDPWAVGAPIADLTKFMDPNVRPENGQQRMLQGALQAGMAGLGAAANGAYVQQRFTPEQQSALSPITGGKNPATQGFQPVDPDAWRNWMQEHNQVRYFPQRSNTGQIDYVRQYEGPADKTTGKPQPTYGTFAAEPAPKDYMAQRNAALQQTAKQYGVSVLGTSNDPNVILVGDQKQRGYLQYSPDDQKWYKVPDDKAAQLAQQQGIRLTPTGT